VRRSGQKKCEASGCGLMANINCLSADISQTLLEARNRWLRPTEICGILSNYKSFSITPEPPNRPLSGSLFLFDRKILRYFRKDGHNWRKKKDGKTIKEAHEKLKVSKCLLFMWETTLWKVAVALLVVIVLMLLYPHY
jgi:hypothetical protein